MSRGACAAGQGHSDVASEWLYQLEAERGFRGGIHERLHPLAAAGAFAVPGRRRPGAAVTVIGRPSKYGGAGVGLAGVTCCRGFCIMIFRLICARGRGHTVTCTADSDLSAARTRHSRRRRFSLEAPDVRLTP